MSNSNRFTSEFVSKCHPDKHAGNVSDSILEATLENCG
ncbi:protein of unknown function [Candidatus Methylopumilus turicensis]|uniref:Uncharacterized protein n=1 Tax=Candidatus Methylopumilus turicensis TaxID=1581680 RepID=A0A0B7IY22_9PROT|nr:protein of unknown function [Candidatus Methylopumilus turicensis]